ncbi:hypothetical protein [Wolbachia endosymbiont of Folsomia candida]|uniref:hypothetical protein n=1 Tax=Wolbachia endosymbiont of Folsomia candida TaxID=169402 RepID=UPI000A5221D1|nr:hypothetical protein [Wolbachia endosymbiont of Folsomia candida]APR98267.1 hypothetical protein ASM33_03100 [Wolbachia endosymbiont of Folsomia candida]
MTIKNVSLALKNIKQHNFKDFNPSDSSQNKLNVELQNGAKCHFDGNSLGCAYSAKSNNPFKQQVDDPSKDYRFIDEIKIENLALKSIETSVKCDKEDVEDLETECEYGISSSCEKLEKCSGKIIRFEGGENTRVNYTAEYPTYSDAKGSVSIFSNAGEYAINMQNISVGKGNFYSSDHYKVGTQSIMKFDENSSFHIENKGFGALGSQLDLGIGAVSYYTEPYAAQHDLEISII